MPPGSKQSRFVVPFHYFRNMKRIKRSRVFDCFAFRLVEETLVILNPSIAEREISFRTYSHSFSRLSQNVTIGAFVSMLTRREEMSAEDMRRPRREQGAEHLSKPICSSEPKIEPLSGKPFIPVILSRLNAYRVDQMVVPAKMGRHLPCAVLSALISYNGKSWEMTYDGRHRNCKRLYAGWKTFLIDNRLEAGDACVFEILEYNSEIVKLAVQILRGGLPSELLERAYGDNIDCPIIIDG
ncbi:hypothetical protein Nepgr_019348 [Nepenthes gracilis]|uniref:TF-B3 domain-containing protein n=1 Tax=Nepenthes gracilis TaxID=150966 RepID=A0AAD3SVR8_NEPGR|nr:hypothetical protein Nepgr_019348 [Nepenthes gracilis]